MFIRQEEDEANFPDVARICKKLRPQRWQQSPGETAGEIFTTAIASLPDAPSGPYKVRLRTAAQIMYGLRDDLRTSPHGRPYSYSELLDVLRKEFGVAYFNGKATTRHFTGPVRAGLAEALRKLEEAVDQPIDNALELCADEPTESTLGGAITTEPRRQPPRPTKIVRQAADVLAGQVYSRLRGLRSVDHADSLLPVRWHNAPDHLKSSWEKILRSGEAAEPPYLGGAMPDVLSTFEGVPSGKLLVLGRSGSGKTTWLVELGLALVDSGYRQDSATAVPVMFDLRNWGSEESLLDWMVSQMVSGYTLPAECGEPSRTFSSLVKQGLVVPLFDGLDEMTPELRVKVIASINREFAYGDRLVVSSRLNEYVTALEDGGSYVVGAAAIQLRDLTLDDLRKYLPSSAEKFRTGQQRSVWAQVFERIIASPDAPECVRFIGALSTPLMAYLAHELYRKSSLDPSELLDTTRFPRRSAVEDYLLDNYIPAAYGRSAEGGLTQQRRRWSPEQAQRWLGFLAEFSSRSATHDIFVWSIGEAGPLLFSACAALIIMVCAMATTLPLFDISVRPGLGVATALGALSFVLLAGYLARGHEDARPRRITRTPGRLKRGDPSLAKVFIKVLLPLLCAPMLLVVAVIVASWITGTPVVDRAGLLVVGTGALLAVATLLAVLVLDSVLIDTNDRGLRAPNSWLWMDLAACILTSTICGLIAAIAIGILEFVAKREGSEWAPTLWALPLIIAASAAYGQLSVQWSQARVWLALGGRLPWSLIAFLEDARNRGLLRRNGAAYQFRHALLRDRLVYRGLAPPKGRSLKHRGHYVMARRAMALSWIEAGRTEESKEELRKLLDLQRSWPDLPFDILFTQGALVRALKVNAELQAAEELQHDLVEGSMRLLGPMDPVTLHRIQDHAEMLVQLNRQKDAIETYELLLNAADRAFGPRSNSARKVSERLTELRLELATDYPLERDSRPQTDRDGE